MRCPDGLQLTFKNKHVSKGKVAVIWMTALNIHWWCQIEKTKKQRKERNAKGVYFLFTLRKCPEGPTVPLKLLNTDVILYTIQ